MLIELDEKLSGENIEVPADMVVLMVNMEAHKDVKDVVRAIGVSLCGNQFFIEKHPKLDPVATTTGGVYIVGTCQGPKDITDSVAQARAAAARILATIAQGSVQVEVTTAMVSERLCCGCQTCVSVCPYTAISYDEAKKVSVVNEVLCKGCGTCGAACPAGPSQASILPISRSWPKLKEFCQCHIKPTDYEFPSDYCCIPMQLVRIHRRRSCRHVTTPVCTQYPNHPDHVLRENRTHIHPESF